MKEDNWQSCPTKEFEKWALGWSGCHGGDISPGGIWICGIEWGGESTEDYLKNEIIKDRSEPPEGYDSENGNYCSQFDRGIFKIINAFKGINILDYKTYDYYRNLPHKPFVKNGNCKGFFKINLYPIAFRRTNPKLWEEKFKNITGFKNKKEYKEWCRSPQNRFGKIKEWVDCYKPRAIICFGKTWEKDFGLAFTGENEIDWKKESIDGNEPVEQKELIYKKCNNGGPIVIVCPFPSVGGLNSNKLLKACGCAIRNIINS